MTEGQQTTLPENAGETVVTVTASIFPSGATFAEEQTVTVSVARGTASVGDFATALPGTLTITIAPGEQSSETTLTLTPNDDVQNEIPETILLSGDTGERRRVPHHRDHRASDRQRRGTAGHRPVGGHGSR